MSLSIPRIFANRYEIHEPVGTGAFSMTYRATDTILHRPVAVKVLRRDFASHENYAARFEREATSAAKIHHPNVVPIFDTGIEGDVPFIVMQFVEGPTLREYVRNDGPLTVEESVNIVRQTLQGLKAIHAQGIVHRDVKPQNILLDDGMVAKLTDFGVAFVSKDAELTEAGMTVGTAAYMAPEQATGETVGPAADIYSTGVILYELLTGRLPFPGDNPVQVMYRHVSEIPPQPRRYNKYIPVQLEAVVVKSLAKIPSDRYPTAEAMQNALSSQVASARQVTASSVRTTAPNAQVRDRRTPPPPRPPRHRQRRNDRDRSPWLSWALIALVLAMIVTFAGVLLVSGLDRIADSEDQPTPPPLAGGANPTEETDPTATLEPTPEPQATAVPSSTQPAVGVRTATAIPTETPAPPEPTATENLEPTVPEATPTTADSGGGTFNVPFPGRGVPASWAQGRFIQFSRDEFVDGGAYRRTDGTLYGRPAAHLYSQETDFPSTTLQFDAAESPDNYIGIRIVGMDDEWEAHVPCRLTLNGNVVWEGESPFDNEEWTDVAWLAGNLNWIQEGENTVVFEIMAPTGDFGLPPWILLTEMTVYFG